MTIGIVVPTFNRYRKTQRFIDRLARQTYRDFCLYLVDSGSIDGTQELVHDRRFPIKLIEATPDDWWAAATNLGVRQAMADGCDPLLTINDDAFIPDNYLERMLDVFQRRNLQILVNRIDFADAPGKVWALGSYCVWSSPFLFQLKYNGWWEDELPARVTADEIYPADSTNGDGVLIGKEVFERIGYYQQRYCPQVHADSEFTLRAKQCGIQAYVAVNVVLYNDVYNLSEESTLGKPDQRRELRRMKDVFLNKKSDLYLKPVFYVVWKYAPRRLFAATVLKFYLYKFYIFFADRHPLLVFSGLDRSVLDRLKRRIAKWAFDYEHFDADSVHHIKEDRVSILRLDRQLAKLSQ